MIIPDVFTIGGGVLGLLFSLLVPALHGQQGDFFAVDSLRSVTAGLQGMLIGSGLVLWIALIAETLLRKEAMGFGDVKFMGAIGAFCGWQGAVFAVFGGAIVGTVWFAVALLWRKLSGQTYLAPRSETPEGEPADLGFGVHVPFGPMLAIAAALHFLFLRGPVAAYFSQIGELL
jgi:leader peptidase (prepilin peptidase)/N-methyltransferase